MLIISIVMVSAFQALSWVWVAKVKLIEQTEIEKQAYFASERFFEMIKKWGTLDYEEYWNRYATPPTYSSWHIDSISNFWNQGTLYHCVSGGWIGNKMGTWGCLDNTTWYQNNEATDYSWLPQVYSQYSLQFIDRNSDNDGDAGDEDTDGSILWDDDDLFLGIWPEAFSGSSYKNKVWELYLINAQGNERTYFRWNFREDDEASSWTCNWGETMTWTGCLWTIEFLKLTGVDYWSNHVSWDSDPGESDWIIDTWFIHKDFNPTAIDVVAGSNWINYWQPIFPDSIHVSDVEFYAYPNKSLEYSWRDNDPSILIAPYIQIKMKLQPSMKVKRKIKWEPPVVDIVTTIQLSSLDLK